MRIDVSLDTRSINRAIKQVDRFKTDLQAKLERFVSELADVGIEVIRENVKVEYDGQIVDFGESVYFQKDITGTSEGATCVLIAAGQPYIKGWMTGTAIVDPLLMAEFGSGAYAVGAAQGSFPTQTHAEKPPWFWKDLQGTKHMSYGNEPSRPMFKAQEEMRNQIQAIADRVFD